MINCIRSLSLCSGSVCSSVKLNGCTISSLSPHVPEKFLSDSHCLCLIFQLTSLSVCHCVSLWVSDMMMMIMNRLLWIISTDDHHDSALCTCVLHSELAELDFALTVMFVWCSQTGAGGHAHTCEVSSAVTDGSVLRVGEITVNVLGESDLLMTLTPTQIIHYKENLFTWVMCGQCGVGQYGNVTMK